MQGLTPEWLVEQLRAAGVEGGAALGIAVSGEKAHQSGGDGNEATAGRPHHGGGDSMALAVLAARLPGPPVTGLVVDHALRPESAAEARQVAAWLDRLGLSPEVLTLQWPQGKPPPGKVQEAAREARYSAMGSVCHTRGLSALLTAHQWDDQAELLLMRLSRASGLMGLAGMERSSHPTIAGRPLHLVRPLLGATKAQLRQVCKEAGQEWVEDPTNPTPLYLRNRIRAVLQNPQAGLSSSDIAAALDLCGRLKGSLQEQIHATLTHATRSREEGRHTLDLARLAAAPRVVQSGVIQHIVQAVGPPRGGRPVRDRALRSLLQFLDQGCRKAASFSIGRTDVEVHKQGADSEIVFTRSKEPCEQQG